MSGNVLKLVSVLALAMALTACGNKDSDKAAAEVKVATKKQKVVKPSAEIVRVADFSDEYQISFVLPEGKKGKTYDVIITNPDSTLGTNWAKDESGEYVGEVRVYALGNPLQAIIVRKATKVTPEQDFAGVAYVFVRPDFGDKFEYVKSFEFNSVDEIEAVRTELTNSAKCSNKLVGDVISLWAFNTAEYEKVCAVATEETAETTEAAEATETETAAADPTTETVTE